MTHFASFNAMKPSVLQNADRCVFVGDLSFFCTELDLSEAFKHCGAISRLEVKRGRHGDSLLYAFVEFYESSCAQLAIHKMNGFKLLGRRMKVNWTDCKPAPTPGADQWVQVHVNFVSRDLSLKLSEEYLESVFIQFGNIGDIIVKRHGCSSNPAVVSGYAFIYFIDAYAAFRAIHGCKGVNVEGVQFECALSRQYENAMSSQHGAMPRGFKKPSPTHLNSSTSVAGPHLGNSPLTYPNTSPSAGHFQHKSYNPNARVPYANSLPYPQVSANYSVAAGVPGHHGYGYLQGQNHLSSYAQMEAALGRAAFPPNGYSSRGKNSAYLDDLTDKVHSFPGAAVPSAGIPGHTPGGRSPSMVATNFPEDSYNYLFAKSGCPQGGNQGYDIGGMVREDDLTAISKVRSFPVPTSNSLQDQYTREEFIQLSSFVNKPFLQPTSVLTPVGSEDKMEIPVAEAISSLLES